MLTVSPGFLEEHLSDTFNVRRGSSRSLGGRGPSYVNPGYAWVGMSAMYTLLVGVPLGTQPVHTVLRVSQ